MKYSLLIDTSNKFLVVGIADESKIIQSFQQECFQGQSELLAQVVSNLIKESKIRLSSFKEVVVSDGPGSFTGVRIGITFAKTFAFALKIPIKTVSSLLTLAGSNGQKIALIDARANRAYVGIYNNGSLIEKEIILEITEIKKLIEKYPDYQFVGDCYLIGKEVVSINLVSNLWEVSRQQKYQENIHFIEPRYFK